MTLAQELIADLARLVAVPSVGSLSEHTADLAASARLVAELFSDVGCPDVRVIDSGGAPAVMARWPAPEGQPTICFYSHHDVQPVGDLKDWDHDPWIVTQIGDRLYGRGSADDKGGIAVHLATMRAFGGHPPVGVTVFIEGEEPVSDMTTHISSTVSLGARRFRDSRRWKLGRR